MECARVDALCSHGFRVQGLEVALSILNHMKLFMANPADSKVVKKPCLSVNFHPLICAYSSASFIRKSNISIVQIIMDCLDMLWIVTHLCLMFFSIRATHVKPTNSLF